jgi:hypothetical protein
MQLDLYYNACRYDLLCLEGIARSLRIFIGTEATPVFKLSSVPNGSMLQMHVKKEVMEFDQAGLFYTTVLLSNSLLYI